METNTINMKEFLPNHVEGIDKNNIGNEIKEEHQGNNILEQKKREDLFIEYFSDKAAIERIIKKECAIVNKIDEKETEYGSKCHQNKNNHSDLILCIIIKRFIDKNTCPFDNTNRHKF